MRTVKKIPFIFVICLLAILVSNCKTDPFGNRGLALISNDDLLIISRAQYDEEIKKLRDAGKIVESGPQYEMIQRIGRDIRLATSAWLQERGTLSQINDYYWEFTLIDDPTINAWAMPGALIVFYTGILPVCENEAAVATVMGHEVAHALLNHSQKSISMGAVMEVGAQIAGGLIGSDLASLAISLGINLGALKFSRDNEYEADEYGQRLMAIAGYNPDEAAPFWERMNDLSSGGINLEFLSTHPDPDKRTDRMRENAPKARALAGEFGVNSFKPTTLLP